MSLPCCRSTPAVSPPDLSSLTTVYSALADPTRLRILALLTHGEVCVCHIHGSLGVPQPTASRHLAFLRRAGLVRARREGIWMHYTLLRPANPAVATVLDAALHALTHAAVPRRDQARLRREQVAG